ncbi:MAG TPA: Cof-type HAD-IIB family hydrolase [Clostridiaceae bacterium]|nr:Cof-type HAD-IIB family hydrolase [Clostridiaceae bacterium]
MRRQAIFIDVDGTFVNDSGLVPESAKTAVREARKNGHLVFLCTGRSTAELFDFIMDAGFDGIIAAAGGYVELEGEVLLHQRVADEDVRHLVDYFDRNGIDFYLESNGGLYASRNCKAHVRELLFGGLSEAAKAEMAKGMNVFIDALIEGEDLHRNDINKISFLGSSVPIETIKEEFGDKFNVIPSTVAAFGENSGELSLPGVHKALAIEMLLEHMDFPREDTMAYGDGMNDAEMIEYVGIGVAMGDAREGLKAIADDITGTADEDGIYNSFVKYGLI